MLRFTFAPICWVVAIALLAPVAAGARSPEPQDPLSAEERSQTLFLSLDKQEDKLAVHFKNGVHGGDLQTAWKRKLRGSVKERRLVHLDVAPALTKEEVLSLARYAYEKADANRVWADFGSAMARELEFLEAEIAPIVIQVQIDHPGNRIDPATRKPWSGVGEFAFSSSRKRSLSVLNTPIASAEEFQNLWKEVLAEFPERPKVLDMGNSDHPSDEAWVQSLLESAPTDTVRTRSWSNPEARWRIFSSYQLARSGKSEYAIYSVGFDGTVSRNGEVLSKLSTVTGPDGKDRLDVDLADVAMRGQRSQLPGEEMRSNQRVLIRAHPSAPFYSVAKLMAKAVQQEIPLTKLEFQIAGSDPREFEEVHQKILFSEAPPPGWDPNVIGIAIRKRGAIFQPGTEEPHAGSGAFVFGPKRDCHYNINDRPAGGRDAVQASFTRHADMYKGEVLLIAPGPGVTFQDVYPLVQMGNAKKAKTIALLIDLTGIGPKKWPLPE